MSTPYIGEIRMFGGNFAPLGWQLCDGSLLQISQNQALFSILGVTYGGNGITTFGIPDLRGRVPMHAGSGTGLTPRVLGEKSGAETVALTTAQIPAHTHALNGSSAGGNQASPTNGFPAVESTGTSMNYSSGGNTTLNTGAIGATGSSQAHSNMQPYLCVNFIIALQGAFPTRA